jgi:thiol:disulfide interchange protein DsbD
MFGVFEIGTSLIQLGDAPKKSRSEWLSSFFSGVLATAVATPCTAPFMGSALGFAVTQPPFVSILIFTMLGVGMALPYVILSSFPSLLRFVPKPGPWMDTFKQIMAFFFLATVLWLAWVLQTQQGGDALLWVLAGLLVQSVGAWVWGRWNTPLRSTKVRRSAAVCATLLLLAGLAIAWQSGKGEARPAGSSISSSTIQWVPYSAATLAELRSQNKPVFVDFTASWCLTCQVNERVVLSDADVVNAFERNKIVTMKADWTNRDAEITRALESFERNGVPFYVLYPADAQASPRTLPEILSKSIVLDAIEQTMKTGGTK